MLKTLSNYDLVYELLQDGKGEVYPDIEPIDTNKIIEILEKRSMETFGNDKRKVIDWFMHSDGVASDEEKNNLRTVLKIINIEKKAMKLIKAKEQRNK